VEPADGESLMNDHQTRNSEITRLTQVVTDKLGTEGMVVVAVMALGFLVSVLNFVLGWRLPPIIIAVMLGSAVAALVHRFLGGIAAETTFAVGAVKLGGSMAALVGCAFFINSQLEKQTLNLDELFQPHYSEWLAISRQTSLPMELKVMGTTLRPPERPFETARLRLRREGSEFIVLASDGEFRLGRLTGEELRAAGLFSSLGRRLDPFVVTSRLPPDSAGVDLDPLPLKLSTRTYGGDFSRFVLIDSLGVEYEGGIFRNQTQFLEVGGGVYLVAVVEVNHQPAEGQRPYAKFAVGEVQLRVGS